MIYVYQWLNLFIKIVGYYNKCFLSCLFEVKYKYNWKCILECLKDKLLGLIKNICFDVCLYGQFKYLQRCVEVCLKIVLYDFKGECVKYCVGYLDGLKCFK